MASKVDIQSDVIWAQGKGHNRWPQISSKWPINLVVQTVNNRIVTFTTPKNLSWYQLKWQVMPAITSCELGILLEKDYSYWLLQNELPIVGVIIYYDRIYLFFILS